MDPRKQVSQIRGQEGVQTLMKGFCSQAVEKLVQGADSGCPSDKDHQTVLNCTRLLTRILPYIFEDADWRGFFWSTVPGAGVGL